MRGEKRRRKIWGRGRRKGQNDLGCIMGRRNSHIQDVSGI